jgi:hypothetical protein
LARQVAGLLGERSAGIHAGAVMHTPVEAIVAPRPKITRVEMGW